MSYKYMRVLVMFDLPTLTQKNMRDYRQFRKYLLKSGFLMLQESVYCKLVPNSNAGDALLANIRKNKPDEGLVQVLRVTEKQFAKMEYIVGKKKTNVLDSDERIIVL